MNNSACFRYILRYKIDPLFSAEDRTKELVNFCVDNSVEEVMFFILAEELTTGHPDIDEIKPYVLMLKDIKVRLAEKGIDLSINAWSTIFDGGRGRPRKKEHAFTYIVGETGKESQLGACPLCPKWQTYICDIFSYYARELDPVAIWIEDDWRLYNHGSGLGLGHGGCFCKLHLSRFGEIVGKSVTRQELLNKILKPGEPHPWRKIWLEVWGDSLIEPAQKLYEAVSKIRLGLMSSAPDTHSVEGRDWDSLQKAISPESAILSRPHTLPYTETKAILYPPYITRHTIANLNRSAKIYPELESSPRCGRYSKTASFAIWQCFNAAAYGSNGITINHFDMMGNGISLDEGFGVYLKNAKAQLNALAELQIDDRNSLGVKVLFNPDISKHKYSSDKKTIMGIYQDSTIWSKVFYTFGIAHGFKKDICSDGGPYAVSMETLRAFTDSEIKTLLSQTVLLDANSVDVLCQKGFSEFIGIKKINWILQEETGYGYESVIESNPAVYGIKNPRMTAQRCADKMLAMEFCERAVVKSYINRYDHKPLFPGMAKYENTLGGEIIMLAYPFDGKAQFFMGFFNVFRQKILQKMLFESKQSSKIVAVLEPIANLYSVETNNGLLLGIFNITSDSAEHLTLAIEKTRLKNKTIRKLSAVGEWVDAEYEISEFDNMAKCTIHYNLRYLESLFLIVS
jgi:hypothetical protein